MPIGGTTSLAALSSRGALWRGCIQGRGGGAAAVCSHPRRSSICASVRVVPRPVVCGEPDRMVGTRAGPAQAVRGKVRHLNLGMYRTHCDGDVRSADMGAPPS